MHVCGGFLNHCTEEDETEEEESDDKQINSNEQQSDTEEKVYSFIIIHKQIHTGNGIPVFSFENWEVTI